MKKTIFAGALALAALGLLPVNFRGFRAAT